MVYLLVAVTAFVLGFCACVAGVVALAPDADTNDIGGLNG